jgi:hypothetical protein
MKTPMTVIKGAVKNGVNVTRFRITKEQGEELKRIEREHGKPAATVALLKILWPKE